MAERKRVMKNTIAGQVAQMKAISAKLESPIPLDADEAIYFDRVVKSRETSTWSENHLVLAANLAITYTQLDQANLEIADRGLMVLNDRRTPVVNPAVNAKSSFAATILQLNKALGLSASQMGVSGKDQEARNQADAQAHDAIKKIKNNPLLA